MDTLAQHTIETERIQAQMRSFYARGKKVKIYHGTTNSTRAQKFEKDGFVDVSQLDHIIEINKTEQYVLVEPNVSMDKLVEETLRYRLVPPVVMEFPGITVGGGIQGGAGESSSFKYGLFHETCLEYEMVLGNGEKVIASPTQNQELFYGTACSYGSLGILTLIKLCLIPSKDFVRLTYRTTQNLDSTIDLVGKNVSEAPDFIDGIMFAKNRGVIMSGNFSDRVDLPLSTFSNRADEWFYLHAEKVSANRDQYEELIPIRDYLFRYDRGAFWMGKYAFSFYKMPFNRFTRFVFNPFCKTRELYKSLHAANFSQRYLIQDIAMPMQSAKKFLEYVADVLRVYPIWLVPIRPATRERLSLSYLPTDTAISVGIWSEMNERYSRFVEINRELEEAMRGLGGRKWLYAHQYYSREQFWEIYDCDWYGALRSAYSADSVFPDIYDKTKIFGEYKKSAWRGIARNAARFFKIIIP